ncbi:hypothetical protein RJT34_10376 [Clitoria ternatea]|uniref:Uncharacterized protein n=1 Tax=Clitoria ternatea TaxID=43366 RepID=A0AAN9K7Y1_CLITE
MESSRSGKVLTIFSLSFLVVFVFIPCHVFFIKIGVFTFYGEAVYINCNYYPDCKLFLCPKSKSLLPLGHVYQLQVKERARGNACLRLTKLTIQNTSQDEQFEFK